MLSELLIAGSRLDGDEMQRKRDGALVPAIPFVNIRTSGKNCIYRSTYRPPVVLSSTGISQSKMRSHFVLPAYVRTYVQTVHS